MLPATNIMPMLAIRYASQLPVPAMPATTVMFSAGVRVGATLAIDWPIVSTKPRLPPRSPGAAPISPASTATMRSAGKLTDSGRSG